VPPHLPITGTPGVGKTTVLRKLVERLVTAKRHSTRQRRGARAARRPAPTATRSRGGFSNAWRTEREAHPKPTILRALRLQPHATRRR
jgi:Cdc6-like AAA superfamily ATPase